MQWIVKLLAVGFLASLTASPARAENYAFLVAVGDYDPKELTPLPFTRNDIQDFRQALRNARFKEQNIVHMHDEIKKLNDKRYLPTARNIREELALLLSLLEKDDSVVVAFAGHGVQFAGENVNYFCASDVRLEDKDRNTLVSLKEVYEKLDKCAARRKLLLVDACRNDPQSNIGRSRSTVKLESLTRPQDLTLPGGMAAFFSCAAGQRSFEHPDLKHGVFFHHVLKGWNGAADNGDGKLTLTELTGYVTRETKDYVRLKLGAAQTPFFKAELTDEWVLNQLQPSTETNKLKMKLVLVPAGEFQMGSPGPNEPKVDERPQHLVRISKPFYLGAHEVTVGNFNAFVLANGDPTRGGSGYDAAQGLIDFTSRKYNWLNTGWFQTANHPVVNVSWHDAVAFCDWLTRTEGKKYRLPTEAEWEYACRAGTTTTYFSGDDPKSLRPYANIADASCKKVFPRIFNQPKYYDYTLPWDDKYPFTAPVGSFKPNPWGLYDMHGNVQEWCSDWYGENYYQESKDEDPRGPSSGTHRVKRGGEWLDYPTAGTATFRRSEVPPDGRNHFVGFRVVREP